MISIPQLAEPDKLLGAQLRIALKHQHGRIPPPQSIPPWGQQHPDGSQGVKGAHPRTSVVMPQLQPGLEGGPCDVVQLRAHPKCQLVGTCAGQIRAELPHSRFARKL